MYEISNKTRTTFTQQVDTGIQENFKLLEIVVEDMKADGTGGKVLRFHFQDPTDTMFTHTEFQIREEDVRKFAVRDKKDPIKEIEAAYEKQGGRIKHILSAFMPEDQIVIRGNSWEDFIGAVVDLAGKAYVGRLFRLKIVYNTKDFPSLPKIVGDGFIQPMTEANRLKLTKYDRVERKVETPEAQLDSPGDLYGNMGTDDDFKPSDDEFAPAGESDLDPIADEFPEPLSVDEEF